MNDRPNIKAGWGVEIAGTGIYHFERISPDEATKLAGDDLDAIHVIETINWLVDDDDGSVQHSKYFAYGMRSALATAVGLSPAIDGIEYVFAVRPATPDEIAIFRKMYKRFSAKMPPVIHDKE